MGTSGGNQFNGSVAPGFFAFGSEVLFAGLGPTGTTGLWVTDGTAAGTSELSVSGANTTLGLFSTGRPLPPQFTPFNGKVLFVGLDANTQYGLWSTDGTSAGTYELKVIDNLTPQLTVLGNKVVFEGFVQGTNGATGTLWVTDGTAAGTTELNVAGAGNPFDPFGFTVLGSRILFNGRDATDNKLQLWVTDGTGPGTSELNVAGASSDGLNPDFFTLLGNKVLFSGRSAPRHNDLWVTDGTAAGTTDLQVSGAASAGPTQLTVLGTEAVFVGTDAGGKQGVWVTDGTAAGTSEIASGFGTVGPTDLTVFGGRVLFSASDRTGALDLWVTDGTAGGTSELGGVAAAGTGLGPSDITPFTPCFLRGSRIMTVDGERRVEDLRPGNWAITASGASRPVVWIGERRVDCRRHPRPESVWPIRIRTGAFGDGSPRRDLLLSPGHSVFCDGVLIPVEHLVNGATVVQEQAASAHYFHIELERHDVMLAEGLPAESYLDDGNRAQFENGAAHMTLHPDFAPRSWDDACAPRCTEGPAVTAARQLLHARALLLGYRIEGEPDLRVLAEGASIAPFARIRMRGKLYRRDGTLHRFLLPQAGRELRIISRAGVPAWLDPALSDRRTLGVRVGGVYLDQRIMPLTSRAFADGFHAIERLGRERWRWTNGAALLRLPKRQPESDPITLDLFVLDTMPGWQVSAAAVERTEAA